jgi:hypothetical protein
MGHLLAIGRIKRDADKQTPIRASRIDLNQIAGVARAKPNYASGRSTSQARAYD